MSLVVFPFKSEPAAVVVANLATAATHPDVDEVWAVASEPGVAEQAVRAGAGSVATAAGTPIRVMVQDRVGELRPGKGDGMNTAIRLAAEQGRERTHFYDADITNFDATWITGAEWAADRGFGVVRHRFPRAATDAMITWFVTRPALARLFPGTFLAHLDQPLGGEILLTRPALENLAGSELARRRSDWGIDTILTYATSVMGLGVYEHHVADGKRHSLYGSLDELREMMIECLDAAASLVGLPAPSPGSPHGSDVPAQVPDDLKRTVAYDIEGTMRLLRVPWTEPERGLAARLPGDTGARALEPTSAEDFSWMDAERWFDVHGFLVRNFVLGDRGWESLAFRLWLLRVLSYTTNQARDGYERAMAYLETTIERYEATAITLAPRIAAVPGDSPPSPPGSPHRPHTRG
jgi:mannosylglycerate synthase